MAGKTAIAEPLSGPACRAAASLVLATQARKTSIKKAFIAM
jgi:hypothetical protein